MPKKWNPRKKSDDDKDHDEFEDEPRHARRRIERFDPFRSLFADFGEFDLMQNQMDEIIRQAFEGNAKPGMGGPYIYGYTVRTGPDGKPEVREFRNFDPKDGRGDASAPARFEGEPEGECKACRPPSESPACESVETVPSDVKEREPLTEVIECGKTISVTIELPGIDKDDIELRATPESLTVEVDTPDRKFHKEFELPCEVNPNKIHATYKNGILDIALERKGKRKKNKGKKINIE
jgi:HSP20 family protein